MTQPTLTEFLFARGGEDAEVAGGAVGLHWDASEHQRVRTSGPDTPTYTTVVSGGGVDERWEPARPTDYGTTFTHIARWDPARVFAECDARLRVIGLREGLAKAIDGADTSGTKWIGVEASKLALQWLDDALKALAMPYADHPDYRPEWRP